LTLSTRVLAMASLGTGRALLGATYTDFHTLLRRVSMGTTAENGGGVRRGSWSYSSPKRLALLDAMAAMPALPSHASYSTGLPSLLWYGVESEVDGDGARST
jgi:hypothetical protein